MTCKHCGSQLPANAKFCTNCGAPVPKEAPAVEAEPLAPGYFSGKTGNSTYRNDSSSGGEKPSMTPIEALEAFLPNIGNYSGRARRSEFWWVILIIGAAAGILRMMMPDGMGGMITILQIGLTLSLYIRRLHDTGRSWKSLLWLLIPAVGEIILLVFCAKDSDPDTNLYGPNPKY